MSGPSGGSPRRVALVITELNPGGAERCLVELAIGVDRSRFTPHVIALGGLPSADRRQLCERLEQVHVPLEFLDARGARDAFRTLGRLRSALRRVQPDLVQTFLFHANLIGRFAARRTNVRRVLCGIRVAERQKRWHVWADRASSRLVWRYVCVSHDVAEFSARSGLPRQKLEVIPNGVDVDRFAKAAPADLAQFGLPRDVRVAVCVGRLDRQKGLDGLLEHAQSLLEPGSVHLLFVGDGPERAQLEQMARAIPGRVHFAGYADRVPEILAASDMLLLPSRWEGMPNVVLEAMAAGKPVVAFDVEGVAELLGPNAHEQVVARGDYSGFAKTALRFADDAALAQKLGAANRRRAEAEFSTRLMVKCYEELWARAMIE